MSSDQHRRLPQLRLGTMLGNVLRRQQQQQQQGQGQQTKNDADDGTEKEKNGTAPSNGSKIQTLSPPSSSTMRQEGEGEELAEAATTAEQQQQEQQQQQQLMTTTHSKQPQQQEQQQQQQPHGNANDQQCDANVAGGHMEQGKGAGSREPMTAPEARQKWGRRRRSNTVVHPLDAAPSEQQIEIAVPPSAKPPLPMARPPSALRLGPSSPTPWVYQQMADRKFRRITVAQLQAYEQQQDTIQLQRHKMGGLVPMSTAAADGHQLLAHKFASVRSALIVQNAFHRLALIVQGFITGLTFAHTLFALFIANTELLKRSAWLAAPVQAFFHFCLAIGIVEALDRVELGVPFWRSLCRTVPSLCCIGTAFFAFLASISSVQIGQLLAQQQTMDKENEWDAEVLFMAWQMLSAVRAVCALLTWLMMAVRPTANATRDTLAKMLPSPSVISVPVVP